MHPCVRVARRDRPCIGCHRASQGISLAGRCPQWRGWYLRAGMKKAAITASDWLARAVSNLRGAGHGLIATGPPLEGLRRAFPARPPNGRRFETTHFITQS